MDWDYFLIDIPSFIPIYDLKKEYGYEDDILKKELRKVLCLSSDGYCMYCYNSIKINGQIYGDLEHGIEKSINIKILNNCVPNISISCSKCNQKYKRSGEKKRVSSFNMSEIDISSCAQTNCNHLCSEMRENRKNYIAKGKILLQPFENEVVEGKRLELQYDLLHAKYIPNQNRKYSKTEIEIIENHIKLFKLNSSERRNREIGLYCKNVIDQNSILKEIRYNNLVVKLLQKKLIELNDLNMAVKICKIIYFTNFIEMAT